MKSTKQMLDELLAEVDKLARPEWERLVEAIKADDLTPQRLEQEFGDSARVYLSLRDPQTQESVFHLTARHAKKTAKILIAWFKKQGFDTPLDPLPYLNIAKQAQNWKACFEFAWGRHLSTQMCVDVFLAMNDSFPADCDAELTRFLRKVINLTMHDSPMTLLQHVCLHKKENLALCLLKQKGINTSAIRNRGEIISEEYDKIQAGDYSNLAAEYKPLLILACENGLARVVTALLRDFQVKMTYRIGYSKVLLKDCLLDAFQAADSRREWFCIPPLLKYKTDEKYCEDLTLLMWKYPVAFTEIAYDIEKETHRSIRCAQRCALEFFTRTRHKGEGLFGLSAERHSVNQFLSELYKCLENPVEQVTALIKSFFTPESGVSENSFKIIYMRSLLMNMEFCSANSIASNSIELSKKPEVALQQFCQQLHAQNVELLNDQEKTASGFVFLDKGSPK